MRCALVDGRCSRLRGQGAIHPGRSCAASLGACPSTRPREPPVVGPGLGRWGRTRRLAPDHDLDSTIFETYGLAKEVSPPRLYRRPRLSPAARPLPPAPARCDVPAARGPGQHRPWRRPQPAWRWGGCATVGPGDNSRCAEAASTPTLSLPPAGKWMPLLYHHPPARYLRDLIEAIPEEDWTPIPYWMDGAADVAETTYTPFQTKPDAPPARLIVRRVKPTPGSQLALFARSAITPSSPPRWGDAGTGGRSSPPRRGREPIRDLKYGVGLNHMPSGRFATAPGWRSR